MELKYQLNVENLRIGFEAKRAFFNGSGLGNYCRNIILALNRFYPNNKHFLFTPPCDGELFPEGKSDRIFPRGAERVFSSYWRHFKLGTTAQNHGLDVFHGLSNELPRDVLQTNATKIVTVHDAIFMRFPQWYKWHDRWLYEQKVSFACQISHAVVAVSEQTKADLIEFFGVREEKIRVIYQPCHPIFEEAVTEEQKTAVKAKHQLPDRFVLMLSNIEERKNHLNAIKAIHYHEIDVPLVIVGRDSTYASHLKKYVAQHGLEHIHFHHDVSSADLPALYSLASIFLYPSFFEGFGIPIVESLWCGTPVIASNTSCFRETAGDAALFVDPHSVGEIAQAIKTLLSNERLQAQMVEYGKTHINRFSAEKIARQLNDIYRQF